MQHALAISEKVRAAITGNSGKMANDAVDRGSITGVPIHQMTGAFKNGQGASTLQNKGAAPLQVGTEGIRKDSAILSSSSSILMNRKLDMEIRGIATSDIDGDGKLDMVVMDDHTISFFIFNNNNLLKTGEYKGPHYNKNISIDALDANGNGRAELFITSFGKNSYLKSYIIEWNGRGFEPLVKDAEWYFRVVAFDGKSQLIGQQRGHDEVFSGAIYSLDLSGNKIVRREKMATGNFEIFGFTPVYSADVKTKNSADVGNARYITWFDRSGFLNLGDGRGGREWKSGESLGSTAIFVEQDKGRDNLKERVYVNNRVVAEDIDNDGITEIITVNNSDVAKGYLSGYRKFNHGNIQIMAWKNGSMVDIWKGNPATGYISDFNVMDMDGDSYPEIIYSVVMDTGIVINKAHSTIFIEKIVDRQK